MTTAAIRAALQVEYQVVYGYGVVGAHLHGRDQAFAADRLAAHQLLRDALLHLDDADPDQPVSAPAYRLPFTVTGETSALELAVRLEDAAAGTAWDLVASQRPLTRGRRVAIAALADVAVAAARWRARLGAIDDPALPGAPPGTRQSDIQPSTTPTTSPSSTTAASGSTS